jgi:hypothetical protein
MKRYLLGTLAIALAVGFSSFSLAKRFDTTFIYDDNQGFSSDAVRNLQNWTIGSLSCSNDNAKPCTFSVSSSTYVSGDHPANVTILTTGDNNYVTDVKDGSTSVASSITNKQ